MQAVSVLLASLVNATVIAVLARRLLGVPVGWPRTLVLSLLVNASASPLVGWALTRLDVTARPEPAGSQAAVLVLVVLLLVGWLLAAEVGLLAVLEAVVPTGSLPGPLELARSLPGRWRRGRRYTAIVAIAGRHGLSRYLTPRGGRRPGAAVADPTATTGAPGSATARALRDALTDGGVTFVKLGQMLATRPDVVPQAVVQELTRLHTSVPAQPWEQTARTLADELGAAPDQVFASIDTEPLAAASVGQVYRATLRSGEHVVVKVQRSDARATVTADLDIVLRLARYLDRVAPWARRLGVLGLAQGFARSLDEELDYRVELRNLQSVAASSQAVRVPRAYPDLSSGRVLTMELLDGVPLSLAHAQIAALAPDRRAAMAADLLDAVLQQVMGRGVFHADLHGGNVLLTADGELALLDFGSVGRLDRSARTALGLLLLAVDRQDAVAGTGALLDLLQAPSTLDQRALEVDVADLVMRFGDGAQAQEMVGELFALVLRHGLTVPPGVAAALRCLGALEGTLRLLDPDLDLVAATRRRARTVVQSELTPHGVRQAVEDQLLGVLPLLQRLPRQVASVISDLEAGRFTVSVQALQGQRERSFLAGLVHQLVLAVLAAAAAGCGVAVVLSGSGPAMTGELSLSAYLGFVLLLFAFVLGCRVVVLTFRRSSGSPGERDEARPLR